MLIDEDDLMCNELIDMTNLSTSSDEDMRIEVHPKKISINSEYYKNTESPQPGDLVLTSLGDIDHPAAENDRFGPRYLILGAVVGFAPVHMKAMQAWMEGMKFRDFAKLEKLEVNWQTIVSGNDRYIQRRSYNKSRYFRHCYYINRFVDVPPVSPDYLQLLKKGDEESIDTTNPFLWDSIRANFVWKNKDGWVVRKPSS